MVCLSCAQKKAATRSRTQKKDMTYYYMSYTWAVPTWHFLHSFAGKVNEDFYEAHKKELLDIIKNISRALPCPQCQKHAINFFKNVTERQIPTKENFRQLLLNFHNDVNRITRKPLLERKDINKYDNSVFIKMAKNFTYIMSTYKGALGGGFVDTQVRKQVISNLIKWVNIHHRNFL